MGKRERKRKKIGRRTISRKSGMIERRTAGVIRRVAAISQRLRGIYFFQNLTSLNDFCSTPPLPRAREDASRPCGRATAINDDAEERFRGGKEKADAARRGNMKQGTVWHLGPTAVPLQQLGTFQLVSVAIIEADERPAIRNT
jgi:hypothetical protein